MVMMRAALSPDTGSRGRRRGGYMASGAEVARPHAPVLLVPSSTGAENLSINDTTPTSSRRLKRPPRDTAANGAHMIGACEPKQGWHGDRNDGSHAMPSVAPAAAANMPGKARNDAGSTYHHQHINNTTALPANTPTTTATYRMSAASTEAARNLLRALKRVSLTGDELGEGDGDGAEAGEGKGVWGADVNTYTHTHTQASTNTNACAQAADGAPPAPVAMVREMSGSSVGSGSNGGGGRKGGWFHRANMPLDPATGKRACYFHNVKDGGCRAGDACAFSHINADPNLAPPVASKKAVDNDVEAYASVHDDDDIDHNDIVESVEAHATMEKEDTSPLCDRSISTKTDPLPDALHLRCSLPVGVVDPASDLTDTGKDSPTKLPPSSMPLRAPHLQPRVPGRPRGYVRMPKDPQTGRLTCYYFNFGGCTNHDACDFLHVRVDPHSLEIRYSDRRKGHGSPSSSYGIGKLRAPMMLPEDANMHKHPSGMVAPPVMAPPAHDAHTMAPGPLPPHHINPQHTGPTVPYMPGPMHPPAPHHHPYPPFHLYPPAPHYYNINMPPRAGGAPWANPHSHAYVPYGPPQHMMPPMAPQPHMPPYPPHHHYHQPPPAGGPHHPPSPPMVHSPPPPASPPQPMYNNSPTTISNNS